MTMQDLKVTLIQTEPAWEDIHANLALFDKKINTINEETDLIVLPEMFTTGFSRNVTELAQDMSGTAVSWMLRKAEQENADITGSVIIKEKGAFFNRLLWAKPDGGMFSYDKKHLFRMSGEEKIFSPGKERLVVELHGWRIMPFICYDLRFPRWTRNTDNIYDLALFVANWPEERSEHWRVLLQARAIENQSYVVGVNRIGVDGNQYAFSGDSSVIDPLGNILFHKKNKESVYTIALSRDVLQDYRENFPAWMDADNVK